MSTCNTSITGRQFLLAVCHDHDAWDNDASPFRISPASCWFSFTRKLLLQYHAEIYKFQSKFSSWEAVSKWGGTNEQSAKCWRNNCFVWLVSLIGSSDLGNDVSPNCPSRNVGENEQSMASLDARADSFWIVSRQITLTGRQWSHRLSPRRYDLIFVIHVWLNFLIWEHNQTAHRCKGL